MNQPTRFPRTYHLPWSLGQGDDDKVLPNINHFLGKQVIVTEKMDGENTSMTRDYIHARSPNQMAYHESRTWVKAFHGSIRWQLPPGLIVCGENVFAKHSIHYDNLESYFLVFAIFDNGICLRWKETLEVCVDYNLNPVPTLYQGTFDESLIRTLPLDFDRQEGYVVKIDDWFPRERWTQMTGKFVREHHVQTDSHWKYQPVVENLLKL